MPKQLGLKSKLVDSLSSRECPFGARSQLLCGLVRPWQLLASNQLHVVLASKELLFLAEQG